MPCAVDFCADVRWMIEFGVLKGGDVVPVVSKGIHGAEDMTPLRTISADLLAYYQRMERAMRAVLTQTQFDHIRFPAALPAVSAPAKESALSEEGS